LELSQIFFLILFSVSDLHQQVHSFSVIAVIFFYSGHFTLSNMKVAFFFYQHAL
jgi:hypothetical protein